MSKNNSRAKKIYNIVSTVIVAAIFIFLVVIVSLMLWQRRSGGDTSLFGYYMFDVVTDSMSGTIEPGEVIISKKVDDVNKLKVGDVITFIAPSGALKGNNITHRIVEVVYAEDGSAEYFRTKGDNVGVGVDDWKLPPTNVKGVYVKKSTFIGGLREFLSHWYGYVLLIALPLCIVGALLIVGYVRDRVARETAEQSANTTENPPAKPSLDDMTEEQKKKLLDEFLLSQRNNPKEDVRVDNDNLNDGE